MEELVSYLFYNVFQLKYCHAHQSVVAGKTVILDTNVKLKKFKLLLVTNKTEKEEE